MGEDIKLPEPAFKVTKSGRVFSHPDEVDCTGRALDVYTADQLRAAVEADRARRDAGESLTSFQILAITTAYEQGVGKGREAARTGGELRNPYASGWRCDEAWASGYAEGKKQVAREVGMKPRFWYDSDDGLLYEPDDTSRPDDCAALYATATAAVAASTPEQPARKPLTEARIQEGARNAPVWDEDSPEVSFELGVRFAERHHGITEN